MKILTLLAMPLALTIITPSPSYARSNEDQIAAINAELKVLRSDIVSLKEQIRTLNEANKNALKNGDQVRVYYQPQNNLCLFALSNSGTPPGNGSTVVTGDCSQVRANWSIIRP